MDIQLLIAWSAIRVFAGGILGYILSNLEKDWTAEEPTEGGRGPL